MVEEMEEVVVEVAGPPEQEVEGEEIDSDHLRPFEDQGVVEERLAEDEGRAHRQEGGKPL